MFSGYEFVRFKKIHADHDLAEPLTVQRLIRASHFRWLHLLAGASPKATQSPVDTGLFHFSSLHTTTLDSAAQVNAIVCSEPGLLFELLAYQPKANPVVVLGKLGKADQGRQYDPLAGRCTPVWHPAAHEPSRTSQFATSPLMPAT
jgi:hypothetical protein